MPTALDGVGRLLDIGDQFDAWKIENNPGRADAAAIEADWEAVGRDLIEAAKSLRK